MRETVIGVARRLSSRLPERWDRAARDAVKIAVDYRGSRRTAMRHLRYAVVRSSAPLLAAPFGPGQVVVDARDEEVGRRIFLTGGYERAHMKAALDYLSVVSIPTAGSVFVDVGANVGTSTIDALVQFGFGRAVCFEPAPDNARLLRANLVLNDLEGRVDVHAVAVSDYDGPCGLLDSPTNSGDRRLLASGTGIECHRLDSFVESGLLDPAEIGLVWIDVQGHEPNVLRGAKVAIPANVPVVIEYCPWILEEGLDDLDGQIADRFSTVVDLRAMSAGIGEESAVLTPRDLPRLAARYRRSGYTDLLLLS